MNILELAREAGYGTEIHIGNCGQRNEYVHGGRMATEQLERFAALIQREMVKEGWKSPGYIQSILDQIDASFRKRNSSEQS